MPVTRLSDRERIINHLKPLMDAGKKIKNFDETLPIKMDSYDKGAWTGLKLIALKYYIKPYLNILGGRQKLAYIDLFSGPGLNLLGDRKVPIAGSSTIPLIIRESSNNFSTYIYSDKSNEYLSALNTRLDHLKKENENIFIPESSKDANDRIFELPDILSENKITHSLVFIDPEGLELNFDSLKYLAENINCDIIINFPSKGIARVRPYKETLKRFLGTDEEPPSENMSSWAIEIYRKQLLEIGKDISTEIKIKADRSGSFYYHLIPAVTRTSGGSPWFRVFVELKNLIEKFDGDILETISQQIDGRATSIRDF
ncbi:MAG: three-Cys-motif partner protein TcmP [Candidatus Aenigmarchaeota archaeon]|nr:three-Cys-motif partner protein TcmP [Candidatus Aenigmarchaeota archaeon]